MKLTRLPFICLAAMLCSLPTAQAAVAITSTGNYPGTVDSGGYNNNNDIRGGWTLDNSFAGTVGLTFNVGASNLLVTALGFYDGPNSSAANVFGYTPDGLLESHDVGIFDSSGTLLTSITIPTTGTTLLGEFRYLTLSTSITLTAGQNYTIAAQIPTINGDVFRNNDTTGASPFTLGSGLTLDTSGTDGINPRAFSGPPTNPSYTDGVFQATNGEGAGYAAGNFQYTVVPEPSTNIALISGLALLALRRRRA